MKVSTGSPLWHLIEAASKAGGGLFTGEVDKNSYQCRLVWGPDYRYVKVQDQNGQYDHFEKHGDDWMTV